MVIRSWPKAYNIPLDSVDNRYNYIVLAFAVPTSPSDMTMLFTPDSDSPAGLTTKIQALQSQGKKVLLSIGGATSSIDLTTTANKDAFIHSITDLINTYGFDGIDIDIEHGNSVLITGGTIAAPSNSAQVNLIDAIKQIMANYRSTHGQKLLLTMAPETAYVQGGQSGFGGAWGGYLPIIDALRDSLDVLQVQLYNSGTMNGIDQNIYTQGTADFIVAMTEAVIQGFSTSGGVFNGLPASKIAIGLPACTSAAGGGFVDAATVESAIDYLMGNGAQPGSYVLSNPSGYPSLRGMMTWSINWDAVGTCGAEYEYADSFTSIFGNTNSITHFEDEIEVSVYPNPTKGEFTVSLSTNNSTITITDLAGRHVLKTPVHQNVMKVELDHNGVYIISIVTSRGATTRKLLVSK